jgi:hypothetical protein
MDKDAAQYIGHAVEVKVGLGLSLIQREGTIGPVVECDIFGSVSQILSHREVSKILAIEYIHCTKQLGKYELRSNEFTE